MRTQEREGDELSGFVGERLRQAREARGMTQTSLAELVDVTQPAIGQYESGMAAPSRKVKADLAQALEIPITHLQTPFTEGFSEDSLRFRARRAMSMREERKAYRHGQLAYDLLRGLLRQVNHLPVRLPQVAPGTRPEDAAASTREALRLDLHGPIPNVVRSLEEGGVIVVPLDLGVERQDAFSAWAGNDPEIPLIILLRDVPGDRQRFSVSHELGHLVLHRDGAEEPESEADRFAAEFLVPAKDVRIEFSARLTLADLAQLKKRWKVSIQMLIRRARDAGVISQNHYNYLFRKLGARGWRKGEPENLPVERPRAFRQMAEQIYGVEPDLYRIEDEIGLAARLMSSALDRSAPGDRNAQRHDAKFGPGALPDNVTPLQSRRQRRDDPK